MGVYVDSEFIQYGRMKMCHMLADTQEELIAMARRIGVNPKWIQHKDTPKEHFDICMSKRDLAIAYGTEVIDRERLVEIIRTKRASMVD